VEGLLLIAIALLAMPFIALGIALANRRKLGELRDDLRAFKSEIRLQQQVPDRRPDMQEEASGEPEAPAPVEAPVVQPAPLTEPPPPTEPARSPGPLSIQESAAGPPPPEEEPTEVPLAAAAGPGIERRLATQLPVWVGAIALTLAGVFLVKYSFESGLLGPTARVTIGLLFGVSLLGAGEWMFARSARVAQGLSSAGVAVLFAVLLAGVNLYGLIPPTIGFALMALITVSAVLLSLRQGPMVAILGLIGGFLMPAWIGVEEPSPGAFFSYLFLLQAGLLLVTRQKQWWPLAGLVLLGTMGWAALWILFPPEPSGAPFVVGLFLLLSVASFLLATRSLAAKGPWGGKAVGVPLGWAGALLGMLLLGALVGAGRFSPMEWGFLGLLGAGCLLYGRLDPDYEGLGWLAAALSAVVLLSWSSSIQAGEELRFGLTALAVGGLYAGGGYAALYRARAPYRWASLSVASAVAFFLVAFNGLHEQPFRFPWGAVGLLLAVVYALLAVPVERRREHMPGGNLTLAALVVAVTVFVSLAVPMELERAWITVAWALEVAAVAWIAGRLGVRQLHTMAWILAGAVGVRLLLNPAVLSYPTGTAPLFNWLLYGYGIPILALAAAAVLVRKEGNERLAEALEWGGVCLGFVFITLQIRNYFHPGDLGAGDFDLAEWGAFTGFWLLYGWGLLRASGRFPKRPLLLGGQVVVGLAVAQTLLAQCLGANPLFERHPVGQVPIFNLLLFVYGLPAILALVVWREVREQGDSVLTKVLGPFALLLSFLLLTLEVRQAFQGSILRLGSPTSNAETYAYSVAWILFGTALLVLGIVTRGRLIRYGSLAVMLLAVGKVFLFDVGELSDLYRVLSFLGLGLSLLLLAFLYQRYVFREMER